MTNKIISTYSKKRLDESCGDCSSRFETVYLGIFLSAREQGDPPDFDHFPFLFSKFKCKFHSYDHFN